MPKTETKDATLLVVSHVGLHELHVDPLNVRADDPTEDTVLTASIAAHGLQMPLIVRKSTKGYGVIAGSRRLISLNKLNPDALACIVPVIAIHGSTSDLALIEASLAENVARTEMSPVQQYRNFRALAENKENPQTVEQIAKRFGQTPQRVRQLLALGALEPSVLVAYDKGEIDASTVRVFTQIASHKTQKAILGKIRAREIHANPYNVRRAAGFNDTDAGKFLALVGTDAYLARGGKIIEDLFGSEHVVSDPELVRAMVNEAIADKVEKLKAEGWGTVITERPSEWWSFNMLRPEMAPTKAETKELKRLAEIVAQNEEADDFDEERHAAADKASEEHDALESVIRARALTPQMKAKATVYVAVNHKGDGFEIEARTPPRAQSTPAAKKAKEKAAKPVEEQISQALIGRLNDTLTTAAREITFADKRIALAGLIAALSSRDPQTVGIRFDSNAYDAKSATFETTLAAALKLSPAEQIEHLVRLISTSVELYSHNGPALDQTHHAAFVGAMDGAKLTKAIRAFFDMASYFDSVPKTTIAASVEEAMGKDHAVRIARMDKASAAKFATENLGKLKWLPVQLRVKGYDGPAKKAAKAPAKKAAKKAKR